MYISVSRLRVDSALADDLVAAFRDRAGLVDSFDGFVDLEVWQSDADQSELMMVSRWRDRSAFKAYMRSREHGLSHDRINPVVRGAVRLERLEHLQTYEVVAT